MRSKEDRVIRFIKTHRGCTRTKVWNSTDMAEGTAKKILKQLIEENKVVYHIDEVNPRKHHLYLNDAKMSVRTKNLLLSKAEEQINNQKYTMAQLTNGEWVGHPVNHTFTITNPIVKETLDDLKPKRAAK